MEQQLEKKLSINKIKVKNWNEIAEIFKQKGFYYKNGNIYNRQNKPSKTRYIILNDGGVRSSIPKRFLIYYLHNGPINEEHMIIHINEDLDDFNIENLSAVHIKDIISGDYNNFIPRDNLTKQKVTGGGAIIKKSGLYAVRKKDKFGNWKIIGLFNERGDAISFYNSISQ